MCRKLNVKIGIITVPVDSAQQVCDMLVESGILAIWNFAPTHIKAPEEILVQNENMASSLALLSNHLREKMANE
jgi:redox-sensing transcriptional repressor